MISVSLWRPGIYIQCIIPMIFSLRHLFLLLPCDLKMSFNFLITLESWSFQGWSLFRLGDFVTMMMNFGFLLWFLEHVDDQLAFALRCWDGKDVAHLYKKPIATVYLLGLSQPHSALPRRIQGSWCGLLGHPLLFILTHPPRIALSFVGLEILHSDLLRHSF